MIKPIKVAHIADNCDTPVSKWKPTNTYYLQLSC